MNPRKLAVLVAALAALHAPRAIAQTAPTSDVPFRVERVGHGRPMILIPGLLSGGDVWNGTVARYRDRYDMHVLTLAGFAGVAPIPAERYLEAERDAVIRYIRENRLEKPVLVGHSLGGFLALWIASTAPDLVGSVVAVDGVPYLAALNDSTATPEGMKPRVERILALAPSLSADQLAMQTRAALLQQSRDTANGALGERWGRGSDGGTMGKVVYEMMTTDLRPNVAAIRAPVLLVASGDGLPAPEVAARLAAYRDQVSRVRGARVVMAGSSKHFIMLDEPAFLFAEMDRFLGAR
jgi:pimeloyl-ACP methyl ester carboxylesterase